MESKHGKLLLSIAILISLFGSILIIIGSTPKLNILQLSYTTLSIVGVVGIALFLFGLVFLIIYNTKFSKLYNNELRFSFYRVGCALQVVVYGSVIWYMYKSPRLPCEHSEHVGDKLFMPIMFMCAILLIGVVLERKWRYIWIPPLSYVVSSLLVAGSMH